MTDNIFSNLNDEQNEAVKFVEKPLLIIAGAGSGKTKVITNKIAYLIKEHGYSPLNILGVTFTNKAANEMKERVTSLTGLNPQLFNISTFHSLGLKILRESGVESGYGPEWTIGDDKDRKKIVGNIVKEKYSYFTNDLIDDVLKKINRAKMNLMYPNNPDALSRRGMSDEEIEIFSLYFDYQQKNKQWDFEDLISLPVILLGNNRNLRDFYESKFGYVLVDEFQDTNPNQYELIRLIASRKGGITVVGDDDQAIYSWRGANIRFMSDFQNDFPGAKVMKMERNYRSTEKILKFANLLIRKNKYRNTKEMWTDKKGGDPVILFLTSSKESEASAIADMVEYFSEKLPEMFPLAILYRINSQSLPFETVFRKRGIGYKIVKGLRFFDRKEIKDSVALLRLAFDPSDNISFMRVIEFLPLGIGPKSLSLIKEKSVSEGISYIETLKTFFPEKFKGKEIFRKIFEYNVLLKNREKNIAELLKSLLSISGYIDYLNEKSADDRLMNIDELIDFIGKWEQASGESWKREELFDRLSLESGNEKTEKKEKVLLLTMHNSKGLEFPTVVMAGVNKTFMPFFMRRGKMEIEEERRLMYVASTRAINRLLISTGGEGESKFIYEVGFGNLEIAYSYGELTKKLSGEQPSEVDRKDEEVQKVEHPLFGEGCLVKKVDEMKYLVDFGEKGEKLIDTSIVKLTFK